MSKAVVILDDMPEKCYDCRFNDVTTCMVKFLHVTVSNVEVHKPWWCPLKELPERAGYHTGITNPDFAVGWNMCLKAIQEGSYR